MVIAAGDVFGVDAENLAELGHGGHFQGVVCVPAVIFRFVGVCPLTLFPQEFPALEHEVCDLSAVFAPEKRSFRRLGGIPRNAGNVDANARTEVVFPLDVFIVLQRPEGEEIVFVMTGYARPARHGAVSAGIDKLFCQNFAASGGVFAMDRSDPVVFHFGIAHEGIVPDIHACLFQQFIQREDERCGGEQGTEPPGFRCIFPIFPARRDVARSVLVTGAEQFLRDPEGDLMPVAVAEGQIDPHQTGSGKTAGKDSFFDEDRFHAAACSLKRRRHTGNTAADHGNIVCLFVCNFHKITFS